MANIPADLRYTREHEWARLDEDRRITIGITHYAQDQLGDVVYLELPKLEQDVIGGEPMGEVESTKSVSDIYAPVSGKVVEVNEEAAENPAVVNEDPYGEGWLVVVEPSDAPEFEALMTAEDYGKMLIELVGE